MHTPYGQKGKDLHLLIIWGFFVIQSSPNLIAPLLVQQFFLLTF